MHQLPTLRLKGQNTQTANNERRLRELRQENAEFWGNMPFTKQRPNSNFRRKHQMMERKTLVQTDDQQRKCNFVTVE